MYDLKPLPCSVFHFGEGHRDLPRYVGGPLFQVGSGFFSDAFARIAPIVRTRVVPYLGRKIASAGRNVARQVKDGASFKNALRNSLKQSVRETKDELLQRLSGNGKKTKRKRRSACAIASKRPRMPDYFDAS